MPTRAGAPPVRAVVRNRPLARALLAYLLAVLAESALWVAVLVHAYDDGGATTAGLASLGLLLPAALVATRAGAAADGLRPNRLSVRVYAAEAAALALAAITAAVDAPLVVVVACAAAALAADVFIRPTYTVVVPGLVTTAAELTAANVLTGIADSLVVLAGPLAASAAITLQGPPAAFGVCAACLCVSALASVPLVRLDPEPLAGTTEPGDDTQRESADHGAGLRHNLRLLARRPGATALLAVLCGQFVLAGALDLLYVILAVDVLDLGGGAVGWLGSAFGVGALVGGASSVLVLGRPRLAPVILAASLVLSGALVALGIVTTLATVLIVLPVAGATHAVIDLTGRVLLQRAAPQEALASVFAIVEVLAGVGIALGSVLVQVTLAVLGVHAAVIAVGAFFGVLTIATLRQLRHVDASADAPVVAIRLLRTMPIFGALPAPALEAVARAAHETSVPAGEIIIREGDAGDRWCAIAAGEVEVRMDGRHVRTMHRGQGFGEIALLADVPRTATIAAVTDVQLLCVERAAFLTAVTGHDASRRTAWAIARDYHPVLDDHPGAPGAASGQGAADVA